MVTIIAREITGNQLSGLILMIYFVVLLQWFMGCVYWGFDPAFTVMTLCEYLWGVCVCVGGVRVVYGLCLLGV